MISIHGALYIYIFNFKYKNTNKYTIGRSFMKKQNVCTIGNLLLLTLMIACGGGGGGGGSSSVVPSIILPPSSINASDGSYNNCVVITWNAVSNAKTYVIYRSDVINGTYDRIGDEASTSYEDSTVTKQKPYFYRVSTISQTDAESEKSQADSGYSDDMPGAITVTATNGDNPDRVSVSWNSDANSTQYRVYRSRADNGSYELIGTFQTTSCDDTTITPGLNYYYKVQGGTDYPTWGQLSNYDNGYASLQTPAASASQGTYTNRITITWADISYETSYTVHRSTSQDGTYTQIATVAANSTSYNDTSSTVINNPDGDYYYKVQAVSEVASQFSNASLGYIALPYPSGVTATDGTCYQHVTISWNAVTGATSYNVYRSGTQDGVYSQIASSITTTSYNDTTAIETTHYYYKVSATKNRESQLGNADEGYKKDSSTTTLFRITWQANREKAVNSNGGGYRVYYNQTGTFAYGDSYFEIPYSSGLSAPTQYDFERNSGQIGTWYVWIVAYSNLDGALLSQPSTPIQVTVE